MLEEFLFWKIPERLLVVKVEQAALVVLVVLVA
jgi:hypothetical protein